VTAEEWKLALWAISPLLYFLGVMLIGCLFGLNDDE